MNRKLSIGLTAAALIAGSVVVATPANAAADDCATGSVCFYANDELQAQIKPGQRLPLGTQFNEIHNESSYTLNLSYEGFSSDEFGYVFSTLGSDRVRAGGEWSFNGGVFAKRLSYSR